MKIEEEKFDGREYLRCLVKELNNEVNERINAVYLILKSSLDRAKHDIQKEFKALEAIVENELFTLDLNVYQNQNPENIINFARRILQSDRYNNK